MVACCWTKGGTGSDGLTPITIILPYIAGVMCTKESSHVRRKTPLDGLSLLDELAVRGVGPYLRTGVLREVFRNHCTMCDAGIMHCVVGCSVDNRQIEHDWTPSANDSVAPKRRVGFAPCFW